MGKEFEGMPQPKGDKQYTIFGIVAIVGLGLTAITSLYKQIFLHIKNGVHKRVSPIFLKCGFPNRKMIVLK